MDKVEAMAIAASDATVSDKIRALDAAGVARAEIARLLGKRYQHVRNVLEADQLQRRHAVPAGASSGVAEPSRRFRGATAEPDVEDRGGGVYRLAVEEDGSVLLPPAVRHAFGLSGRGVVMARLEGDEFKVISAATALRRIDDVMRPYRWAGGPLVSDELIADRRSEAARETDD